MNIRTAAFAVALLIPALVRAEDIRWFGNASGDGGASLIYGTPESDYAPLSFSCENRSKEVVFTYEFEPANKSGPVVVTLRAGDIEVPINTKAEHLEEADLHLLIGKAVLDERLVDLLTSRTKLRVVVGDGSAEFPLDGTREAAKDLFATCKA
ncbi:hypothetical protein [Aminobacter carboxidus]|uniref:Uncharacterized protein n=1 Tax=Aminobacter carboxidus TaxID=376165 RepID=A0A8E2BDA6_9HYPH|nr:MULTISPECIES: hypothetical protein [Aminobacter carboxidus group]MBB6466582.1 hypothetical protein [Aminobacter lissarensis]MBE1203669.1 hypothetical protein [Aminobacter carboxidus]